MLRITMRSGEGAVFIGELADLFRTVQVHGEVPFIEPRAGMLLNLTQVERIEDDGPAPVAQVAVETCPHGYVRDTCSRCQPGGEYRP